MADAKNTVLFPYETLKKLSMDAFQKFGFSEKEADIIQDVLLTSDLFGIQSHGMQRMVRYHKGITNGLIKIDAKPEIVKETPISAVIDGHDAVSYTHLDVYKRQSQSESLHLAHNNTCL